MAIDTQSIGKSMNELLVLATLRGGARHGYQIALEVEARSGGAFELQHGTLYPILHRLERERLIRGRWQKGGGRQRKEYVLTRAGQRHLGEGTSRVKDTLERLMDVLTEAGDDALRARPAEG
ncbi:MAG TPA: helix-turn-helix transcriptional regulator [Longimicrobiales bacterium]|nr:helix-turn-helix transcriptional regulator [Longimicrobiales bacterium]